MRARRCAWSRLWRFSGVGDRCRLQSRSCRLLLWKWEGRWRRHVSQMCGQQQQEEDERYATLLVSPDPRPFCLHEREFCSLDGRSGFYCCSARGCGSGSDAHCGCGVCGASCHPYHPRFHPRCCDDGENGGYCGASSFLCALPSRGLCVLVCVLSSRASFLLLRSRCRWV